MTDPPTPPTRPLMAATTQLDEASVDQLVSEVSRDVSQLMREEVQLAKEELKHEATRARKNAELLGGVTFAAYLVVVFLSLACWAGLSNAMDAGWAALVVAGLWAAVGLVLFATGRTALHDH